MLRLVLPILLLLAACQSEPEQLSQEPPAPPVVELSGIPSGHILGVAPKRVTDARKNPRVYLLCKETGLVQEERVGDDLGFDFHPLTPGSYRLTIKEPTAERDSWSYHHRDLELTADQGVEVKLEPLDNPAYFRIRAAKNTPPLIFLLTDADLEVPPKNQLGDLLEADPLPSEKIHYSFANDGHGPFDVPPLPAGHYQIMTIAIDWEPGDPPVELRAWPIELRAGETRTVRLQKRLAEVTIR